jgi:hypothetical protein
MVDRSITFELVEQDVVAATRLAMGRRLPVSVQLVAGLGLVIGILGIWLFDQPEDAVTQALSYAVVAAALALGLVYFFVVPLQARRHFRQLAALKAVTTLDWNETGATFSTEKAKATIDWQDFHSWIVKDDYLLLFQSFMFYNLVPTGAFKHGQLDEFCAYLVKAGVKGSRPKLP